MLVTTVLLHTVMDAEVGAEGGGARVVLSPDTRAGRLSILKLLMFAMV